MSTAIRSKGVTLWGYVLVISSLIEIWALVSDGYTHYAYLHQDAGPKLLMLRWCFSWIIKISGIVAGIGILMLNDWCRKFAIFNSLFTVLTVNLKHTYAAYSLHTKYLDQTIGPLMHGLSFQTYTWPALIVQRLLDIVFGISLIWFFTRPQVRKQFNQKFTGAPL
jgi:hypothetical protein